MSKPLDQMIVTSPFGYRKPVSGSNFTTGSNHQGVDLRASTGTPVYSAAAGKVAEVGKGHKAWGTYVDVLTPDGYKQRFAHLSAANVSKGQQVNAGQQIGKAGATGNVTAAHLHYGVYDKTGAAIDPIAWLNSLAAAPAAKQPAFSDMGGGVYQIATGASSTTAAAAIIAGAAAVLLLGVLSDA